MSGEEMSRPADFGNQQSKIDNHPTRLPTGWLFVLSCRIRFGLKLRGVGATADSGNDRRCFRQFQVYRRASCAAYKF
jgi:hypothetical protein